LLDYFVKELIGEGLPQTEMRIIRI